MNGARARIVRGVGCTDEARPVELVMKSDGRNLRGIMSATPEPSVNRQGEERRMGRRATLSGPHDPVAEDQAEFIRQVIALLESHRRAAEFGRLVVYAEPGVLGSLRSLMPKALQDMVQREVSRNLLHLSTEELFNLVLQELEDGSNLS